MKVLFVATVVKTHIMEFHLPYLKMLKEMGWETAVAAGNDYENHEECHIPYCDNYYDIKFKRNPFDPRNAKAYRDLKKLIDTENYDIIHCHTPVGGAIARLAATKARKNGTKIIYTAHGFHFYKGAPLINWILYYPVERALAHITDVLITINTEDYKRSKSFKAKKISYMPGIGIDIDRFTRIREDRNNRLTRHRLGIPENATILLSVGEVNKNKNHKVIIQTLKEFENTYFILCGSGPLTEKLKDLSNELGVSDKVLFMGYRNDVEDFYLLADYFVFPSLREGLPVALMEAMASGIPCIASRNRGTNDLMMNSSLLFEPKKTEELIDRITKAISEDYSEEIVRNLNRLKEYDIRNTVEQMKSIYLGSESR